MDFLNYGPAESLENGTVGHGATSPALDCVRSMALPLRLSTAKTTVSRNDGSGSSAARDGQRFAPLSADNVTSVRFDGPQNSVSINMALAREGAAIAAAIGRREQLQYFEDLIADALYDHETGVVSHRRQAEAVLASLLNAGVVR